MKASNSPRDRKDGIRMAKKIFEGRQLFSNNDIFLGRYAFNWSDVGRRSVLLQSNASIRLRQNLNKILHTVVYTKDLWHTTRDLTVKYTDQPKIGLKSVKKKCTTERFLVNIFLANTDIAETKVSLESL